MDFVEAKTLLARYLRSLDPSGAAGFEGLLRDILVEVTGVAFGLAKSGPQGGSDVRSMGVNRFEVALEAKRYEADTRLPLDQLRAKIVETWQSDHGADLWILAATREISATDLEALTKTGLDLGITVLILDWPVLEATLPDLAVLCGEAQAALRQHLTGVSELDEVLETIRAHPGYLAAAQRTRLRLTQPDIGYAAARDAIRRWTIGGLQSDRNAASRLGGKFHNLLSAERKLVRRGRYDTQLSGVLSGQSPTVLLGNEGMGKTWLFLSWWHETVSSGREMPLTLFLPAKDVREEPFIDLLARVLSERVGSEGLEFWRRRIGQWLRQETAIPQFLIMIDGLNQNWSKRNWAELIQPAFDDDGRGRFAIVMSCWPDHWAELQRLASLAPTTTEILVDRFDDNELDALLVQHGLDRSKFSHGMQALMSVPRLSALAISRHQELAESGDITPERLAVEDWKHRIELRGAALSISDAEFQSFVSQLGDELRLSIEGTVLTRHGVLERLGRDSGRERDSLQSTVNELIAGRWLEPAGRPNHFKVNAALVPFALGLSLAHQLKDVSEDAAANAIIADHIDPFRGQTLGSSIMRAAVTAALLDRAVLRPARRALLTRWLAEQNFSSWDFEAFWRVIGLDSELVFTIIEDEWLGRAGSSIQDEIFIKGLANAYSFPAVGALIRTMVTRWLGWFWEDPMEGAILGRVDLTSEDSRQRQTQTAERLAKWNDFAGRGEFPDITLSTIGDPSWLSHRVFGILSLLPRTPFIDAIAAWGITRAIMNMPRHFNELAWLLRINSEDAGEADRAVCSLTERLLETGHPTCLQAAYWIMEAQADPESISRLRALRPGHSIKRQVWDGVSSNEALLDPDEPAEEVSAAHIRQTPLSLDVNFREGRDAVSLAKRNPSRLLQAYRNIAVSARDGPDTILTRPLSHLQTTFMMVLTTGERMLLLQAMDTEIRPDEKALPINAASWEARRLELRLADLDGPAQLTALLSEELEASALTHVARTMIDFDSNDVRLTLNDFPADEAGQQQWLRVFAEFADAEAFRGWCELPNLLKSEDERIRKLALQLASVSRDAEVLEAISEHDWSKWPEDRHERHYGSKCLLHASIGLERPSLLEHAEKEIAAHWLVEDPDSREALTAYETFFRGALLRLQTWRGSSFLPLFGDHLAPIGIMLDKGDTSLWAFIEAWIDDIKSIRNHDLMDEFPMVALTRSLMTRRPELGLKLWSKLMEAMRDGFVKLTGLPHIPFLAPSNIPVAGEAWNDIINSAVTDEELSGLARLLCEHQHIDWLVSWIGEKSRSGLAGDTARAITILGFCDEDANFGRVWEALDTSVSDDGWLRHIFEDGKHCYDRNRWARHWYGRFLAAQTPEDALASRMLLEASMDGRATLWIERRDISALPRWKRQHWDLNVVGLNNASKKQKERLKDKLFWTKIISKTQAPWI